MTASDPDRLLARVGDYYAARLDAHGPTPLGVDWPCRPTQELRFVQLLKGCDFSAPFSLNDLGCGYGALRTFMAGRWPDAAVDYLGIDLVPGMIRQASRRWRKRPDTHFAEGTRCTRVADHCVASGIFNVKLDLSREAWTRYIQATLTDMWASSRRGFAVNFLTADGEGNGDVAELYRTAPDEWLNFCAQELGVSASILASYGMREFTLIARK
ncbi:MAG TPA: class I SAM-dependent methyltransferase [Ramlibacter sp.]|nr:class I SAM-dependent methyltransferase [Ramlibacter sp.]